ncbi:hypothetical protein H2200_008859 [Cladophialophora chaetospira]|uniref:Uncharacterized protein n=1 Tax=Cladophialophora chaetospira TaxID=386627 RepID=A0AA39CFZ3_9EURO|nr:hypothetical protein H2200_008859 [Cladophialophora chaetospira]
MGFFLCFQRLCGFRKRQPVPALRSQIPEKRAHNLPSPDQIYQPYLPMSANKTYCMYLQADGIDNEPKLVDTYLDKTLKNSVISEHTARETHAEVTMIPRPISLQDDRGRQHLCHASITVTWYLKGKQKVTPPQETFYILEETDDDIPVRLRGDIEPSLQLAAGQVDVNDLYVQQTERETKRMSSMCPGRATLRALTNIAEGKKEQKKYEEVEKAKRDKEKEVREAALMAKYKSQVKKK